MKVFSPISDKALEDLAEPELLVPYQIGMIVDSQLRESGPVNRHDVNRCEAPEHHRPGLPARQPCRR